MGLDNYLQCVQTKALTEAGYQVGVEHIRVSGIQKKSMLFKWLTHESREKQKDKERDGEE